MKLPQSSCYSDVRLRFVSLGLPGERIRPHNFLDSQFKQLSWWSLCGDWPSVQWGLRTLSFRHLRTGLEFTASQYLPKLRHEIIFMKKQPDCWVICGFLCVQWTWITLDAVFSTRSRPTRECIWFKCSLRGKKKVKEETNWESKK